MTTVVGPQVSDAQSIAFKESVYWRRRVLEVAHDLQDITVPAGVRFACVNASEFPRHLDKLGLTEVEADVRVGIWAADGSKYRMVCCSGRRVWLLQGCHVRERGGALRWTTKMWPARNSPPKRSASSWKRLWPVPWNHTCAPSLFLGTRVTATPVVEAGPLWRQTSTTWSPAPAPTRF